MSKSIVAYALAALVLWRIADYKTAVAQRLNQLVQSGDYPSLLENGNAHFDERSLRLAIRYYKLVTQLLPENDGPYAMIGYCYANLGENASAIKYYQQARMKAPTHVWNDYNLGMLYLRSNDQAKAFKFFHDVLAQDIHVSIDASILASLKKIPAKEHQMLMVQAVEFMIKTREDAFKMTIKLDLRQQHYAQALEEAMIALKDPTIQDKEKFILYACIAAYGEGKWKDSVELGRLALENKPNGIWEKLFFYLSINHLDGVKTPDKDLWAKLLRDPEVFSAQEGHLVLHPWANYIQPGKEIYF